MILKVNPHKIELLEQDLVNEKEIDISKCEFEFVDIPNDYVKEAYFTLNGNTYKQILVNNECKIPNEVLVNKGMVEIGCVCFKVDGNDITRYNPSPVYINTLVGSLKQATNTEPVTPTDKEQMEQIVTDAINEIDEAVEEVNTAVEQVNTAIDEANNLNLDVNKVDKTATVEITKKDNTTKSVNIYDGVSLQFMWSGTSLGIKTDNDSEYTFVNLQGQVGPVGPQGNPFQVKKTYATVQAMIDDYDNMEINDYVMISGNVEQEDNAKLFVKTEVEDPTYRWQYLADFSGASGVVGPQGASVTSATINSSGELVLTVE